MRRDLHLPSCMVVCLEVSWAMWVRLPWKVRDVPEVIIYRSDCIIYVYFHRVLQPPKMLHSSFILCGRCRDIWKLGDARSRACCGGEYART